MTLPALNPAIRFGHFGINCFNLEKMEAFYKRAFGFFETDRGYVEPLDLTLVFMTLDPSEHHQMVLGSGRKEGELRSDAFIGGGLGSAINQMSFELHSLDEMRAVRDRFAEFGITNGSPINHGNAWALYIRDPEGNPIELYLDTPWYTPQPCGVPLDLSLSNDEIYLLTEEMCRSRPGFEPADVWSARVKAKMLEHRAKA